MEIHMLIGNFLLFTANSLEDEDTQSEFLLLRTWWIYEISISC